ncbi:MAG TPA: DUF3471 domain-containing protein [Chitinophagaceae bacterium]|nr:DUF3471 domain-containing protein [Chitinophagaceae bacterium]
MNKLLLIVLMVFSFNTINAQTSPADSLKEYTGKYKFPDGTPFPEVTITLENGTLTATSVAGSAELKRREGDVFDILSFGGTATFKRNDEKKITKLQVQVNDLDVEGEKTEGAFLSDIFWRYSY